MVGGKNIASRAGMPDNYVKVNELLRADEFSRSRFKEVFKAEIDYVDEVMDQVSYIFLL